MTISKNFLPKYSTLRIPKTRTLCLLIREKIIEHIEKEVFLPGYKLPPEARLAEMFDVGRSTIREAMRLLEEEGFITRKAGKGTFVRHESALPINPLDQAFSITELIAKMGKKPGTTCLSFKCSTADANPHVVEKLNIEPAVRVITIRRVRTADETPVVYQNIVIPQKLIDRRQIRHQSLSKSIFVLLERNQIPIDYVIAELAPMVASEFIADKLSLDVNEPLMFMEQIGYTKRNRPVVYAREYWRKEWLRFRVFRKR